jgi:hypothetical protein
MNCQLDLEGGASIWAVASRVGTSDEELELIKDGEVSADRIDEIKLRLRAAAFVLHAIMPEGTA